MVRTRFCVCFATPPSASIDGLSATRERSIGLGLDPFDGLKKRIAWNPSSLHSLKEKSRGNKTKPLWVEEQVPSLISQSQRGLGRVHGSSLLECQKAGDELIGLCNAGELGRALDFLSHMDEQRAIPSVHMYKSLLHACGRKKALAQAKLVHAQLVKHGFESTRFLGEYVVVTLVKCGGLEDAVQVFQRLSNRTVLSWAALISGHVTAGQGQEALRLYHRMREEGLHPNKPTFLSVLKACGALSNLQEGKRIHADILKYGNASDVFVGTCLIDMYAKCGHLVDAQNVFDWLPTRNIVSWTAMLAAYAQQGQAEKALQLYEQMCEEGTSPDDRTFVTVLKVCGMLAEKDQEVFVGIRSIKINSLEKGKAIHADAWRKGYDSDIFVGSTLISMYGKCGCIECANKVFDGLSQRNLVSWNTMLAASAQLGQAEKGLKLYEQMLEEGFCPDDRTFVSVLQACGMLAGGVVLEAQCYEPKYLQIGKTIHAEALRKACLTDIFVSSTLISMYGRCGSVIDGQRTFHELSEQNVVSWNAMIATYIQGCQAEKALWLYGQMREEAVPPDHCTFVSALQACGMLADSEDDSAVDEGLVKAKSLHRGKAIHVDACRKCYDSCLVVANTLISMYGKCGSCVDAHTVFRGLSQPDVVSWNVMLTAYAQQGKPEKALQLYEQMQEDGECPDEVTIVCILQACSDVGSLEVCRQLHQSLICTRSNISPLLATTLIHAYGRCSSMLEAQAVFDALSPHDAVSWNALIAGYAREGSHTASLQLYEDMRLAGIKPDGVTFLSLLSACSHAGLVEKGIEYIEAMTGVYGITPAIEHYVCMVDLLGRAGCFSRLEEVLSTMPTEPNLAIWLCVLGACQKHGKLLMGKHAFDSAVHLYPQHASAYLLMSNIYADAGLLTYAKDVYALMQKKGARKKPGQSWIEHEQEVLNFSVGDPGDGQQDGLYDLLEQVRLQLEACSLGPSVSLLRE